MTRVWGAAAELVELMEVVDTAGVEDMLAK